MFNYKWQKPKLSQFKQIVEFTLRAQWTYMEPKDRKKNETWEQVKLVWGHLILVVNQILCVCVSIVCVCHTQFYVCVSIYTNTLLSPRNKVFPDMFLTMYSSSQWEETGLIFTLNIKFRFLWRPALVLLWCPLLDLSIMPLKQDQAKTTVFAMSM